MEENSFLEQPNNEETQNDENQPFVKPSEEHEPQMPYFAYGFTPETYAEKKGIRRIAAAIGISFLCISILTYAWAVIYLLFATKVAHLSYSAAADFVENPAVQQVMQIVLSILMFIVPFTISAKCFGYRIDNIVKLSKPVSGTALPLLLFGIGFCSFSNIASSQWENIFERLGFEYNVSKTEDPVGVWGFLLTFLATAIVPALVEEFAFRGIVLGMLRKYGETFAIVVSAITFGIMHGNFEQMPFAALVGLVLGYICVKTGSIWTSVAVHSVNNAIAVIFSYLTLSSGQNTQNLIYMLYLSLSILVAIIGICLLSKQGRDVFSLQKSETAAAEKQKYKWFFTSWVIIVFIVLNIIDSLAYFVV